MIMLSPTWLAPAGLYTRFVAESDIAILHDSTAMPDTITQVCIPGNKRVGHPDIATLATFIGRACLPPETPSRRNLG